MKTVLIIDDEVKLRNLLSRIISLEGFEVIEAGDCKTALKKLEQYEINTILCDVKLPDGNGVELSKSIKSKYPTSEIILLTANGNISDGVQAIKNGAFDYITKGDDNNKIIPLLYRAFEKVELTQRVQQLEKQLGAKQSFESILGKSKSILNAIELAKKVAQTDATVLLTGETGTGKEIFAQAIHQASLRRHHNFVAINCSAFSKELLESEMFGHKAGAFTGAIKDHKGLFEEANNGSIFLDEIGEMPLILQAKLLRVLESGEFIKVGESKTTKVNIRIIAATNRDLLKEMEGGNFREDLFYRISAFQIKLPPLRERIIDIEVLTNFFIARYASKTSKKISNISSEFREALKLHSWPGNIRELKNVIERSLILLDNEQLKIENLPPEFQESFNLNNKAGKKQLSAFELASAEKLHIQKVLNYTNGNKTKAAELLGIALTTLYRKLDEYKLG
ncbi:MAG: sigma-54-dependent Fis family transcriptional regulator [Saprospiraceae bacterium]|nr:sigma-54-dependent Fis family transcriptional regulator [Saprospiraceae bacterium]MBK9222806.1 sigma-54-dependent Fis family transcriptional regulator [Saprospiraceae bacterium]MBK9720154.1 sigma-54-dependent Fis family transcriptional regulator [Saprospiraceae bacterium]